MTKQESTGKWTMDPAFIAPLFLDREIDEHIGRIREIRATAVKRRADLQPGHVDFRILTDVIEHADRVLAAIDGL